MRSLSLHDDLHLIGADLFPDSAVLFEYRKKLPVQSYPADSQLLDSHSILS